MKTIPDKFKIAVSIWGDDRRWCCRVAYRGVEFAATGDEVEEMSRVRWDYCFTDIARTVRAYRWSLTVFQNADHHTREPFAVTTEPVNYATFCVDVRHLFTVIQKTYRRLRGPLSGVAAGSVNVDGKLILDIRRFQIKPPEVKTSNLIQLIRHFTTFERQSTTLDPVPRWREWSRSLKPFAAMAPDKWVELRQWLCTRRSSPGHFVWPSGEGELGFNMAGIHGAVICRGNDWSSHT